MNLVMLTRDAYAPRRPRAKKGRDNLCAKLFLAFVEKCPPPIKNREVFLALCLVSPACIPLVRKSY